MRIHDEHYNVCVMISVNRERREARPRPGGGVDVDGGSGCMGGCDGARHMVMDNGQSMHKQWRWHMAGVAR